MAIRKHMDLSTAHITRRDNELAQEWDGFPRIEAIDHGYVVFVPDDESLPNAADELREFGFTEAFVALLRYAAKKKCRGSVPVRVWVTAAARRWGVAAALKAQRMTVFDLPGQACPSCGVTLDAARCSDGSAKAPEPGDSTLCFHCGAVLMWDWRMELRRSEPAYPPVIVKAVPALDEAARRPSRLLAAADESACRRCAAPIDGALRPRYCDECVQGVGAELAAALAWDVHERGLSWRDAAHELAALLGRMGLKDQAAHIAATLDTEI